VKIDLVEIAGLTTRIVGPQDAALTVVLLHGFGAPGDDLVSLADFLGVPARFVFPEAPLEIGGLYGDARAWWMLDLAMLEADMRSGSARDRRSEVPEGLAGAREQLMRFLDQLQVRYGIEDRQLVLGGFSQGAMVSLDVALHRKAPPAALILLSGTLLAESEWGPRMATLAKVPILQSHGRNDAILPFSTAEILRDKLRAAGATVDFVQFVGGHEIPPIVLDAAGTLLRRLT
jgi:phospholipase/carboxylesterase